MYRKIIAIMLVSLGALLLAYVLQLYAPIKIFALKGDDLQFRLFAESDRADPRIVLINVDQASLDHFEKDNIPFPWPRSLYNPIIEYSTRGGAKAIIFDILYNNDSPYGVGVDEAFAAAIQSSGRVYLAAGLSQGDEGEALTKLSRFGLPYSGTAPVSLEQNSASFPLPVLFDAVAGIGNVKSRNDVDGVFRRVVPFTTSAGQLIPTLGAAPIASEATDGRFLENTIEVAGRSIPINERGEMLIRYHGPRGTYRSFSAANVIMSAMQEDKGGQPSISKDTFRDAYVIVGYTALGLFDNKATPLSPVSPGMEIHANLLDNILNHDFMAPVSKAGNMMIAWFVTVLAIASVFLLNSVLAWAAAIFALLAAVYFVLSQAFSAGYLISLWSVLTAMIAGLILASAYRYRVEGKDRRFIAKAFGRYVSPQILTELKAHPEKLTLGGKKADLTLLFSDLEGFTSISENLPPEKVVQFLNLHMSAMTKIIYRHGGTVQTFMGDGIFAFWGAPVESPDQAILACRAAVEMQAENKRLKAELEQAGYVPVNLRIGLNSGPVVVGNMGSEQRFDYTPIGDSVNLAARLEGVNKLYKTEILLSAATAEAIGDQLDLRRVDKVRVKGKDEPIEIFTPCDDDDLNTTSEAAVMAYRDQDWDRADQLFNAILESWPEDSIATHYLERISRFRQTPPGDGADWDGSVALEKM
jgi:adenylate cyclase